MKNLRTLLASDSDSFNEKLKIVVYSYLSLKVFILISVLWN